MNIYYMSCSLYYGLLFCKYTNLLLQIPPSISLPVVPLPLSYFVTPNLLQIKWLTRFCTTTIFTLSLSLSSPKGQSCIIFIEITFPVHSASHIAKCRRDAFVNAAIHQMITLCSFGKANVFITPSYWLKQGLPAVYNNPSCCIEVPWSSSAVSPSVWRAN